MSQKPRRKYSHEFMQDAVKLVTEQSYRLSGNFEQMQYYLVIQDFNHSNRQEKY